MGGGRGHSTPTPTSSSPQFQEVRRGSLCNQAIMLITDGAVEDYEPVFQKYNWPDRKVPPGRGQGGGEGKGVPPLTAEGCSPPLYPMRPRTCSKIRVTPEAPCEGVEMGNCWSVSPHTSGTPRPFLMKEGVKVRTESGPLVVWTLLSLPCPAHQVRVFTYLIGREVSFADRLKWIACNNKGGWCLGPRLCAGRTASPSPCWC